MNMIEMKRKQVRDFIALYRTMNPKFRDEFLCKMEIRSKIRSYRVAQGII